MSGLAQARRLVVKVGSALLVDEARGTVDHAWLSSFADDAARIRARGQELLIVSSGAIALGRRRLGLIRKRLDLPAKQAAAATGQSLLMHAWEEAFKPHGMIAAQILLSPDDTETRRRWLNARATLERLMTLGVTPIINENDTVATEEDPLCGDNDRPGCRASPRWSARTCWFCSPTSTASIPPIRAAIRTPATSPWSAS